SAIAFSSLRVRSFLLMSIAVTSPEVVTICGVTFAVCFMSGADLAVGVDVSPGICTGASVGGAVAAGFAAALGAAPAAVANPEVRRPSVRAQTVSVRIAVLLLVESRRSRSGTTGPGRALQMPARNRRESPIRHLARPRLVRRGALLGPRAGERAFAIRLRHLADAGEGEGGLQVTLGG